MDRHLTSTNTIRSVRKNREVHFRHKERNIKRKETEWKAVAAERNFDRAFSWDVISPEKHPLNKWNQGRQIQNYVLGYNGYNCIGFLVYFLAVHGVGLARDHEPILVVARTQHCHLHVTGSATLQHKREHGDRRPMRRWQHFLPWAGQGSMVLAMSNADREKSQHWEMLQEWRYSQVPAPAAETFLEPSWQIIWKTPGQLSWACWSHSIQEASILLL